MNTMRNKIELACEYATNPLGVDTPRPRFGWLLESDERAQSQSAYRVLVATSEQQLAANVGDKWDSGKVQSDQSVNVEYQGKDLASGETCYWKVQVWPALSSTLRPEPSGSDSNESSVEGPVLSKVEGDEQGQTSTWSQPGSFEMGLLKQDDPSSPKGFAAAGWKGQWIGIEAPSALAKQQEAAARSGRRNVALFAEPTTSVVRDRWAEGSGLQLDALNDGFEPAKSDDKRYGTYRNYPQKGAQWVQYEWPEAVHVDGIDVYWFDDRGGVRLPETARLLYWDGKAFVPVKNPVGLEGDRYNTTTFDALTTSKLKLEFDSDEASTGILEFKVYDAGKSPEFPPTNTLNRFVALANAAVAPSPLLRKAFTVTKAVRQARVHVSGIGWSELYLNGQKVSDDVLSPNLTDYSQEVLYRSYDVTRFLKSGANAVGMMLGNGWYSATSVIQWEKGGPWGDGPRAILQMTITYEDGTETGIVTDESWKASTGAIGSNQLVFGEAYDARLEKPDWNTAGYDDRQWSHAALRPAPEGTLRSQRVPPMKVQDTFSPIKVTKHDDGGWLFEFDRYSAGWVRLRTKGKAGTTITIHYESIPAGWRTEGEKDSYTLKGDPDGETYEPRFTLHPLRFVRVEGLEEEPTLDTLQGREVYSDVDMHGSFSCSNDLFNQIHGNIQRSLKVALKGIIIDCVHREPIAYNEPCGIFTTLAIRKCMPTLWARFARDIQLTSSDSGDLSDMVPVLPGMNRPSDVSQNASYPMVIWYLYQCYGDQGLLEQHYQTVKAWVDFIGREGADSTHVVRHGWLGEHMLPKSDSVPGWSFYTNETPKEFIWTCYYYQNVRVLADMSRVLGKQEHEDHYAKLARDINAVVNKTWLDPKTGHYATTSQTSEILALALDIVPQENEQQLIDNIAKTISDNGGRMRVGHVGLPAFMETLVDHGLGEVVYKAVNSTEFPGWGYMISHGATTVWEGWSLATQVEEWNGNTYHAEESMIFLAAVSRFFYDSIAGIQEPCFYGARAFEPGYGHIRIKPHPLGDLTHAEASIKTVRGIISSRWKRTKHSFVLEIEIPVGSTAHVSVPTLGVNAFAITEGGKAVWQNDAYINGVAGITDARRDADRVTFDVGSGSYCFELTEK